MFRISMKLCDNLVNMFQQNCRCLVHVSTSAGDRCYCDEIYNSYCLSEKSDCVTTKKFWRILHSAVPDLKKTTVRCGDGFRKAYINVTLKNASKSQSSDDEILTLQDLDNSKFGPDVHVTVKNVQDFTVTLFTDDKREGTRVLKEAYYIDGKICVSVCGRQVPQEVQCLTEYTSLSDVKTSIDYLRCQRICRGFSCEDVKNTKGHLWTSESDPCQSYTGENCKTCTVLMPSTSLTNTCRHCNKSKNFLKSRENTESNVNEDKENIFKDKSSDISSIQAVPENSEIPTTESKIEQLRNVLLDIGITPERLNLNLDSCKNEAQQYPTRRRWDSR